MHSQSKRQKLLNNLMYEGGLGEGDAYTAVKHYPDSIAELLLSEDSVKRDLAFGVIEVAGFIPQELYEALSLSAEGGYLQEVLFLLDQTDTKILRVTEGACKSCLIGAPDSITWCYLATESQQRLMACFAELGIAYNANAESKFVSSLFAFKETPSKRLTRDDFPWDSEITDSILSWIEDSRTPDERRRRMGLRNRLRRDTD